MYFTTAYFPPIEYFSKLVDCENIYIDIFENYTKQSYRNRCDILSANGRQSLTIPVLKGVERKTKIKDIEIDYSTDWQKIHLKSIEAAYRSSPFYEFFMPEIQPFFEKKYKFLYDFNYQIFKIINDFIEIDTKINFTTDFIPIDKKDTNDFRFSINPKQKDIFSNTAYTQVFSDKFKFEENLSILDLIFNMGGETLDFLSEQF